MKIMVIGSRGQLGKSLVRNGGSRELVPVSSSDLDIREASAVTEVLEASKPGIVINAAAYTAVDRAEDDEAAAMAVNAKGVRNIALAARGIGARLIHISTDFVFGNGHNRPILPDEQRDPASVYGRSKLAGELEISEILDRDSFLVLRTAWLYSKDPGNFTSTMLRLMNERSEIGVVNDQIGTPTWVETLAKVIFKLVDLGASGTHHVTDEGVASWFDFAVAIRDIASERGLVSGSVDVKPIGSKDYPTPARRPSFSVLDKSSLTALIGTGLPHWRHSLESCLGEIKTQ